MDMGTLHLGQQQQEEDMDREEVATTQATHPSTVERISSKHRSRADKRGVLLSRQQVADSLPTEAKVALKTGNRKLLSSSNSRQRMDMAAGTEDILNRATATGMQHTASIKLLLLTASNTPDRVEEQQGGTASRSSSSSSNILDTLHSKEVEATPPLHQVRGLLGWLRHLELHPTMPPLHLLALREMLKALLGLSRLTNASGCSSLLAARNTRIGA
mmetsp:Transcript_21301/g.29775  ORF Transcript_21301/g.29775 Transcript_21301/m.29775 type:complete len:216 (-) Transcript_21301:41-688(-)